MDGDRQELEGKPCKAVEAGLPDSCGVREIEDIPCEMVFADNVLICVNGRTPMWDGPPDGFLFVLPYLDLQSRLTMERVCKSLREAVSNNPIIWQHLHVERPASKKLSDEILITLTKRAEGRLKSLSLVECLRITEAALEEVLAVNPGLEKLAVPGCTGISAAAIVRLVESHSVKLRAKGKPGIKQLRIRGLYNITKEQLDLLLAVLQPAASKTTKKMKPRFYKNEVGGLAHKDDQPIDVEVCPRCENITVVYDCTRHHDDQPIDVDGCPRCKIIMVVYDCTRHHVCRGCTFCIPRCEECGRCITRRTVSGLLYDQTSCADLVCASCWFSLPKCSDCNRAVCSRHSDEIMGQGDTIYTCEECVAAEEDWLGFVG